MSVQKPVILKKGSVVFLSPNVPQKQRIPVPDIIKTNKKYSSIPLFREDVIFESNGESFLKGEYRAITILNRLNNLTQSSRTIAKCTTLNNVVVEKTSDNITRLLGQEAYNTIFYSLCSVINQEYRIRSILALLTVNTPTHPGICIDNVKTLSVDDKSCQTHDTRINVKNTKVRTRIRKVLSPYVVQDLPDAKSLRKLVIDPATFLKAEGRKCKEEINCEFVTDSLNDNKSNDIEYTQEPRSENSNEDLPDLGHLQDENSSDSVQTSLTFGTFRTTPELMLNPISLVSDVDRNTKERQMVLPNYQVILSNRSVVMVPFKPEDEFHIATKENLQFLNNIDRQRLLMHQMKIDLKYCLTSMDEDGNLPIHLAVINDDLELLKRQCIVLKLRGQSVDIPAGNGLTALKLSLFRETASATCCLLSRGADPLRTDGELSASVHIAAELNTDHLAAVLHHARRSARKIISKHAEELQKPAWEQKTDEELSRILLDYICCALFDKRGYTPLMLASKLGHYENVRLVLEQVPGAVNVQTPSSGHTALYLAVAAACAVAADRGNESKIVDHFRKTIEILLEYGADPSIDSDCGSNVNLLLSEFNCKELSMLVANKVTYTNFFKGEELGKNFDKFILVKDVKGDVKIREIDQKACKHTKTVYIVKDELIKTPNKIITNDSVRKNVICTSKKASDIVLNPVTTQRVFKRKIGVVETDAKKSKI